MTGFNIYYQQVVAFKAGKRRLSRMHSQRLGSDGTLPEGFPSSRTSPRGAGGLSDFFLSSLG